MRNEIRLRSRRDVWTYCQQAVTDRWTNRPLRLEFNSTVTKPYGFYETDLIAVKYNNQQMAGKCQKPFQFKVAEPFSSTGYYQGGRKIEREGKGKEERQSEISQGPYGGLNECEIPCKMLLGHVERQRANVRGQEWVEKRRRGEEKWEEKLIIYSPQVLAHY
ncbi:hypothetical protein Q8A67_010085 [Cirrhinus molitorella]|uniref:Uncharacterized protein n=1 Tax=Cirrhinus molitorella TaxID=172907 RepID=A0AA88TRV0_9TELE|nr:hypothetical protein Q8A67_010085 [Cirrhinus molitorella]